MFSIRPAPKSFKVPIVLFPEDWDKTVAGTMAFVAQSVYQWGSEHFGSQDINTSPDSLDGVKYVEISVSTEIMNSLSKILSIAGEDLNYLYKEMMRAKTM